MVSRLLTIYISLFLLFFSSCTEKREKEVEAPVQENELSVRSAQLIRALEENPDNLDYNLMLWGSLLRRGETGELTLRAGEVYRRSLANGNDSLTTFSAAYLAQAFVLSNQMDSVLHYLNAVNRAFLDSDDILNAIIDNISATYAIRVELNYTKALNDFMRAYKVLEKIGSQDNQVAVLCNIAAIYYERGDTSGLAYTRKAQEIAKQIKSAPILINMHIMSGSLYCLGGQYDNAFKSLDAAYNLLSVSGLDYWKPWIEMSYADLYFAKGNMQKAERLYRRALENMEMTDSGSGIMIMYRSGKFFAAEGNYREAQSIYQEALRISYQTKNIEYRQRLLEGLSDVTFLMGDKDLALEYYRNAQNYADSILARQKEIEFNQLQMSYQKKLHEDEMTIKELDMKNARRTSVIVILILMILAASALVAFFMVRRRNRMYRVMINMHQEQIKRKKVLSEMVEQTVSAEHDAGPKIQSGEETRDGGDDGLKKIYLDIERLMKEEHLYRDKEVSLNMIADRLESNRAYISRAINVYSKNTFYNYINVFRMDEATAVLSDPLNDIPLKKLADDLGYNSISAFYRAFQNETGCPPSKYREEMRKKTAE